MAPLWPYMSWIFQVLVGIDPGALCEGPVAERCCCSRDDEITDCSWSQAATKSHFTSVPSDVWLYVWYSVSHDTWCHFAVMKLSPIQKVGGQLDEIVFFLVAFGIAINLIFLLFIFVLIVYAVLKINTTTTTKVSRIQSVTLVDPLPQSAALWWGVISYERKRNRNVSYECRQLLGIISTHSFQHSNLTLTCYPLQEKISTVLRNDT